VAKPRTLRFGNFKVYVGDGADPEVFAAPCGFTSRALKISGASSSTVVDDCDDPNVTPWTESAVTSLSGQVTGSGVLAMASLSMWRGWIGKPKNIRILFDDTGANGGGYYEGVGILVDLSLTGAQGSEGGRTQISVQIDNDGEWTWVDNA
jgi:hypothetical protein